MVEIAPKHQWLQALIVGTKASPYPITLSAILRNKEIAMYLLPLHFSVLSSLNALTYF